MKITRHQLRKIILESINLSHDDLETYTDLIVDHVFQALNDPNVKTHLSKIEASSVHSENLIPLHLHVAGQEIKQRHMMINDVILEIGITDDGSLSTTGGYAANTKDRSQSDFIITVILPDPDWQNNLGKRFENILRAEIEELVRHELEHSIHETSDLIEPGDASQKWDSLNHIFLNFASKTETKSHIAGFKRKVKFINSTGDKVSIEQIITNYIQNVVFMPGIQYYGYSQDEMTQVSNKIYETWMTEINEKRQ